MTDAYLVYQESCDLINKPENGYFPAALFNRFAWKASRFIYNDYIARIQNPNTAAVELGKLRDRLFPFQVTLDLVNDKNVFRVPDDYAYFSAGRINFDSGSTTIQLLHLNSLLCEAENDPSINVEEIKGEIDKLMQDPAFVPVQLLGHDQVATRMTSAIPGKRPSQKKPIMWRVENGFYLAPNEVSTLILSYYRRPQPAKLVMQVDPATKQETYNQQASTGFEWNDEAVNDLAQQIAILFATHIRENDLFQMAQANKNE